MAVIVVDRFAERAVGLVQNVLRVVILPEAVMHPVLADIDKVEIVPLLGREQVPHHLELGAAHGEDLVAEPGLVVGAKTLHVDRIVADELANLLRKLGRMREDILVCIRCQEAAHGDAVDPARRVAWRNADDDRSLALTGEMVPDGRRR